MVLPLFGAGVVQADGKISLRRASKPLFNDLPGGQQVRQRDDTEIVSQRGPQHRSAGEGRRDAGHHFHLDLGIIRRQLQHRARHAVDSGVAAADHSHRPAIIGCLQRPAAAVDFLLHRRCVDFLARVQRRHQVHIHRIAAEHLRRVQGRPGLRRQVLLPAGAQPHHIDFTHSSISNPAGAAARPAPW